MSETAVQVIARGERAACEAAAAAIDADPMLEGATYSILEEDEDRDVWRIDAFPTSQDEVEGLKAEFLRAEEAKIRDELVARGGLYASMWASYEAGTTRQDEEIARGAVTSSEAAR